MFKIALLILTTLLIENSASAQSIGSSEIMMSRGTIFKFRESLSPKSKSDQLNGADCPNCYAPLEPGEFVLTYPSRQPSLPNYRIPVLTASGIFGTVRGFSDNGYDYLISENDISRLHDIVKNKTEGVGDWVVVVKDIPVARDVIFTRGEILPVAINEQGNAVVKIREAYPKLSEKFSQLQANKAALANSIVKITDRDVQIDIGKDINDLSKYVKVDFEKFSELRARRVPTSTLGVTGTTDLSERWPRLYKSQLAFFEVKCGQKKTLNSSLQASSESTFKAGFEADLRGIINYVGVTLGANFNFSEKFSESISSSEEFSGQALELKSIAYLSTEEGHRIGHIGNEYACPSANSEGVRFYRAYVPDLGNWAVDQNIYKRIQRQFEEKQLIVWKPYSGKLSVKCYAAGYRALKEFFLRDMNIHPAMTDAILSQIVELNYPQPSTSLAEFYSC